MQSFRINRHAAWILFTLGLVSPQNLRATAYDVYIAGTNPVAWWGMNETGATNLATTADLSGAYGAANNQAGGNLPMTYQGAGTNTLTDQEGFVSRAANRAVYFDGSSSSGAYAHSATPYSTSVAGAIYRYSPNGFAGEAWIKRDGNITGLDSQRVLSTREFGFGIRQSDGALHFTTFTKQDFFGASVGNDTEWHQIGFSFDGNVTTQFFIDGVAAGTSVGGTAGLRTAATPEANTMNLGHRATDSQHFKGTLDEAVLWGNQRSAADFAASYLAATMPAGTAYDTWATTTHGMLGQAAALDADTDHDGLPNGIEFVLGSDPASAPSGLTTPALQPTADRDGNNLAFTFTCTHEAAYLNPVAEFNTNLLGPWTTAVDPDNASIAVAPGSSSDTVTVTIPLGSNDRMFARLKVSASGNPPSITLAPQGSSVTDGGYFTLSAKATGTQLPTWQWYLNGSAIPGATTGSYTVTGANPSQQGDYHVVVTNGYGSTASSVAHITVNTAPGISGLNLVPWPLTVLPGTGDLTIPTGARIVATDTSLLDAANVLATEISATYAHTLPVVTTAAADGDIVLTLDATLTGERHTLNVDTRAMVSGGSAFSVSLGTATLLQALRTDTGALLCPRVAVDDTPAMAIRALHLDLARANHSLESLLQAVDLCRLYKVNYLHLHFNDDQAYTFPSTAYPLLNTTTTGRGRLVYTLANMQALEAYAVARGVHIMPELEGPGHNALMLAAYPDLFKITYPITAAAPYVPSSSVNVAKASVRAAWRTLIGEMCAVFQSTPYFHLGCDEVDWAWSEYSTDFQAAFTEWGFNRSNPVDNVHLVFCKFITLARGYAAEFGKKSIVWENSAVTGEPEVPAPTDVLVMPFDCWNPVEFPDSGLQLVNAAWSPLYVVNDVRKTVATIYAWNRTIFGQYSGTSETYNSSTVAAEHVLGTQLTTFEQEEDLEMMSVRARLAATSERTWNPALGTSYANFRSRLTHTDAVLDAMLSPVRIAFTGLDNPDDRVFSSTATVSMSLAPGFAGQTLTIRFTTNRSDVTNTSTLYTGPFQVTAAGVLRAAAFNASGQRVGRMVREYYRH